MTCATCGSIPAEIHHEDTSPPAIPERDRLERVTDTFWRCATCGTIFRYEEWTPGGSEDFQRTWYNVRLARLPPDEGDQALRGLLDNQSITLEHARRLGLPIPDDVPGETVPLATDALTFIDLPAIEGPTVAVDPERDALFIANSSGHRALCSLTTGSTRWSSPAAASDGYVQATVSPTGEWIAVAGSKVTLTLYDAATGASRQVPLPLPHTADFVPPPSWIGGSLLALHISRWHSPSTLLVVDATSAEVLWSTSEVGLRSFLGSPDGALLALWRAGAISPNGGLAPNNVQLVDPRTGDVRLTTTPPSNHAMAWSPDSRLLFLAGYQVIACIDVPEHKLRWQDDCDYTGSAEIRVSPDGAVVAFRLGERGLVLRQAATGAFLWRRPIVHAAKLVAFEWSDDSSHLITAGEDHGGSSLRAWDRSGRWANAVSLPAAPWTLQCRGGLAVVVTSPRTERLPVWRI